jgi:hypothetical protein
MSGKKTIILYYIKLYYTILYYTLIYFLGRILLEKMPWLRGRIVKIQQEGAKPHVGDGNTVAIETAASPNQWRFIIFRATNIDEQTCNKLIMIMMLRLWTLYGQVYLQFRMLH